MDFIKNRKYRLLGSTALLVGGTICGGPLGGAVGSVVAGMIANDILPQHLENLTVRLRDTREQLGNGNLTEAVGLAIGLLIKARAEQGTFPDAKDELVSLAKYAVKHWKAIAKELKTAGNANFAQIQDTQALGLFSQALGSEPVPVLEEADWVQLLQEMQQQVEMQLPSQIMRQLALDLHEKFAFALREVLKADCSGDGKAFGGLVISMLGAIHARLQEMPVAPESQQEVAKAVKRLKKETKKLRKDKARFRKLAPKLDGGIEQILGKLETTEDILNSLQVWLQGELSQISEKLDKIQDTVSGNSDKLDDLIDGFSEFRQTREAARSLSGLAEVGDSVPQTNHWQGRENEEKTVCRWLDDNNRKLGIIVGIAGMGKSALAAKIYGQRQDFRRKYWAELGERPKFVGFARQVLRELVQLDNDKLEKTADTELTEMLVKELQRERFLLVLDNFESVVADVEYGKFLQRWLNRCRHTEILVTTQVEPELSWRSKPQVLPLQWGLSPEEGAQLLAALDVEETEEERKLFSRKVSGHPLTLCLVAGMLGAQRGDYRITLADLTAEIGGAMEQLQGCHREDDEVQLLVVLDRCFRRLSEVWQKRLLRLTVLRQGFDRSLVEAMVGESIANEALHDLSVRGFLVALETKNRQEQQRYEFQPFILEYLQYRAGDVTKAHQQAVAVYESRCQMPETWKTATVEDVQDYLELFYHLCQLGEYEQAFDTICNNPGSYKESVDNFLDIRGYNSLLVELYLQLVQHLCDRKNCRYTDSSTSLGIAYCSLGEYREAIFYYQQSLEILQEIGDRSGIAYSLNNLGGAYNSLGEYQKAISYFQQSLKIFQQIGDRSNIAISLNNLGIAYGSLGEYREAIFYYQQSLEIFQQIGDRSGIAISLGNLGCTYDSLGEYQEAISYHQESLEISQEIGDRSGIATSLNNLGSAYNSLGEYREAISYYQQSLEIEQEIGDRSGIAMSLGNLGRAYYFLGEYLEAISHHQQCLEIFQQIGNIACEGRALDNFGETLIKLECYSEAEESLQTALTLSTRVGDIYNQAHVHQNFGLLYQKLGNSDLALSHCQQALELSTQLGIPLVAECQSLKQELLSMNN